MARHGGGSHRSERRLFQWAEIDLRTEVESLAITTSLGNVSGGLASTERLTWARMRGNALVRMVAAAASDSMIVGLGIVQVDNEAFAAGAASVPSPTDDLDASWIWHQLFVFGPAVDTTALTDEGIQVQRAEIDTKAMRKMGTNETLIFVWDGIRTAGSPTASGIASARCGFLLT